MSRIGKAPVTVPSGVTVTINEQNVEVKGPKGTLAQVLPAPITVAQEGDELVVSRPDDHRKNRSLHGLSRSLINNMVEGVTKGCLLYTSPSPRDLSTSRMPSSA